MGLGALYLASGLLVLAWRKWAATIAVAFLVADVLGRVAMTASGLFPLGSFRQAFAIAVGTLIAAGCAVTVALNRRHFR